MTINSFNSVPLLGTLGSGLGIFGENKEAQKIYGKKPVVPEFPSIEDAQTAAISDNQKALPASQELAKGINRFNQDQILEMLKRAVPDYEAITARASSNILQQLGGQIPEDVANRIMTGAAGRAVRGGFSQSGMGRNLTTRDLGLTSLDLSNRALDSATRWISSQRAIAAPAAFDVSNMFLSPAQRFAADEQKFGRDYLAASVEAAPDPVAAGQFNTQMQVVGMVLGAMGGGGGAKWQNTQPQQYGTMNTAPIPATSSRNPGFSDYGTYAPRAYSDPSPMIGPEGYY